MIPTRRVLAVLSGCAGILAAGAPVAAAGTVDHAADDGLPGSLRYELTASATPGETITIAGAIDPVVTDNEITITQPGLKLVGNGASTNVISATGTPHRLIVNSATALGTEIRGVTLTGGEAPDGGSPSQAGGNGGAIRDLGSMILDSVRVVSNDAGNGATGTNGPDGPPNGLPGDPGGDGGWGGGVVHENAVTTLTVRNSYFSDNVAGDGGDGGNGGAGMGGAGGGGGAPGLGGSGAAIALFDGTMEVTNTTVDANSAGDSGSCGAPGLPGGGSAAPKNGGAGGGIHSNGTATIDSVTVTDNEAGDASGGPCGGTANPGLGGGIGGSGLVARSVVSSNTGGTDSNCASGIVDGGNNIAFPGFTGCTGFEVANPLLQPPALNGSQTETRAIPLASPAFGHYLTNCPARDQRGVPRPSFALCDIGAFEIACTEPIGLPGCPVPVVPTLPSSMPPPVGTTPTPVAAKKCKKGRKLKKGKCVKRKRKKK